MSQPRIIQIDPRLRDIQRRIQPPQPFRHKACANIEHLPYGRSFGLGPGTYVWRCPECGHETEMVFP